MDFNEAIRKSIVFRSVRKMNFRMARIVQIFQIIFFNGNGNNHRYLLFEARTVWKREWEQSEKKWVRRENGKGQKDNGDGLRTKSLLQI